MANEIIDKIFSRKSMSEVVDFDRIERAILRNPMVDSITINDDGYLRVTTKRITAVDVNDDDLQLDLGKVEIVIKPNGGVYAFPSDPYEFNYPSAHPNVGDDGHLCIGNAVQITDAITDRDLPMLITLIIEYLEVSNDTDGYWHPFRDNPCELCRRPYGDYCWMCECRYCNDRDTSECKYCDEKRKCNMENTRTYIITRMCSSYSDRTDHERQIDFKPICTFAPTITLSSPGVKQIADMDEQLRDLTDTLDSVEYAEMALEIMKGIRMAERNG